MPRVEPGGRNPAPGPLRLVQELVNTRDLEDDRPDQIGSAALLAGWLGERGLLGPGAGPTAVDVRDAQSVREALRSLLLANNGGRVYPVEVATLNRAAAESGLRLRFASDGFARLEPQAGGTVGALGKVLACAFLSMSNGSWERLKACRRDDCRYAFFDQSKNRSGHWCTMTICGNRAKARALRARRSP